jgi:hypothetical protein
MLLQFIGGITNGLKKVIVVSAAHGLFVKLPINLITMDLPTNQKLLINIFLTNIFYP